MSTAKTKPSGHNAGPISRTRLILASTSPRRAQLLRDAGYSFDQVDPAFDEQAAGLDHLPAEQRVASLAEQKTAAARVLPPAVIIGCDTLLSLNGRAIGKPADDDEARHILQQVMARPHEAFTGVCLLDAASLRRRTFVDAATVRIEPLAEGALNDYIRSGQWRGKAGGYNLAELSGHWRFTVTGDPTTVIGLPMRRLGEELKRFGLFQPTR